MAFAFQAPSIRRIDQQGAVSRFLLTAGVVSLLVTTLPGCKESGASWKGKYTRYAASIRQATGRTSTATAGTATIAIDTNKVTYDVLYGANNVNHVVQVYSFKPDDIAKVKGGYDVKLVHLSMVKTPTNLGYFPDSGSPLLKVRGKGDNAHFELEFVDTKGTRGAIDFSVGGKNLSGAGDADFD